jgi:serine/threonine-protein kinase
VSGRRTAPLGEADGESPPVLAIGELVGDAYEVRALLGAGGMGEVYEAHDRVLNRRVALKVMRPNIPADYLLREGRALAALHNPGVVAVHTMGLHRDVAYLVMERVHGLSLDRVVDDRRARSEPFETGEVLDLLVAIADTLAVVHRAGLAHRDVKPGNVMLAPGGRVVLMDFGLVLPQADRAGHRIVEGSMQYMPPEALAGVVAEGEAPLGDIYALGVLGYELLVGQDPHDGDDATELYQSKAKMPQPRVGRARPDVPPALDDLLAQLMSPDPNERPPGADAVLWSLRTIRARVGQGGEPRAFSALLVDDDADMRTILSLHVRAAVPEAVVEETADGRGALAAVRRHVPDLLLLDLDLPDMNGVEVCMLLRGMELGDACMIVSVSARATRADVELLEQLGVQSLVKGPTLGQELGNVIRRMRPSSRGRPPGGKR